jgi:predicted transcriptional regulator
MAVMRKNLHVTLPDDLDQELRSEAERSGQPATEMARDAIREFLCRRRRQILHDEITAYAREVAGSQQDLDVELEESAIDDLVSSDES